MIVLSQEEIDVHLWHLATAVALAQEHEPYITRSIIFRKAPIMDIWVRFESCQEGGEYHTEICLGLVEWLILQSPHMLYERFLRPAAACLRGSIERIGSMDDLDF